MKTKYIKPLKRVLITLINIVVILLNCHSDSFLEKNEMKINLEIKIILFKIVTITIKI